MKKPVDQIRVFFGADGEVREDARGRVFFDEGLARFTDLSCVRLIRCGVDTVRQHYRGVLDPALLCVFDAPPGLVEFGGYSWHASRVGRDSGYQFKLQNADLGLILLLKNFNCKPDVPGPHLKIEVSPHAIDAHSPESLQALMDGLARQAMSCVELNQCAVHIALDFQGWTPPADLDSRMHCRATSSRRFAGIESLEWADKSATYARGQSFLWGSAGACQLALYNKTVQARAIDKLDYWEGVWRSHDSLESDDASNYDPAMPVWRLELRYHHSVVQQFAEGSASTVSGELIDTRSFAELAPHLDGLWRYGFKNFRLMSRPGVIDPFWSLARDDVHVQTGAVSLLEETDYRRYYKTARGFSGKNIDLMMGNLVSLLARQGVGAKKGFEAVKTLPVWDVIRDYYLGKGLTERDIFHQIRDRLAERVIRWGRAV